MSRFGMCFVVAVLVISAIEGAWGQNPVRSAEPIEIEQNPRSIATIVDKVSPAGHVPVWNIPGMTSNRFVSSPQALEKLLEAGRWEDARRLIQMVLDPNLTGPAPEGFSMRRIAPSSLQVINGVAVNNAKAIDTSKPILPDKNDPMYLAIEKDIRLEINTMQLVKKYNNATGEEKDKLLEELTSVVQEHFEVRQKLRELEVERLEKKLETIRTQITHRAGLAIPIVQRRVDKLIGRANELDWDVGGTAKWQVIGPPNVLTPPNVSIPPMVPNTPVEPLIKLLSPVQPGIEVAPDLPAPTLDPSQRSKTPAKKE